MYCRSLPFYGWLLLSNRRNMCTRLTMNISKWVGSQWQKSRVLRWPSKAFSSPSFWWDQGADSKSVNSRGWMLGSICLVHFFCFQLCPFFWDGCRFALTPLVLLVYTALTKFPWSCFWWRGWFRGNHHAPWECCKCFRMSHCQNIYISGSKARQLVWLLNPQDVQPFVVV